MTCFGVQRIRSSAVEIFPELELSRYSSLGQIGKSLHNISKTCVSQYLNAKTKFDGLPVDVNRHFTTASSKREIWLQSLYPCCHLNFLAEHKLL